MAASADRLAINFAGREILPLVCQALIGGPNRPCCTSQMCSLSEDLEKQIAASRRNGTVGRNGKATPIAAKATESTPADIQIKRI